MKPQNLINDKQDYQHTATHFFNIMFAKALRMNCGEIEIKGFENGPKHQSYHSSIDDAVSTAYVYC